MIISAETSDYEGDCTVVTDGRTDAQKAAGSDNDCDDETSNKTERENLQDERPGRLLRAATPSGEGMVNFSLRIYVASLFRSAIKTMREMRVDVVIGNLTVNMTNYILK